MWAGFGPTCEQLRLNEVMIPIAPRMITRRRVADPQNEHRCGERGTIRGAMVCVLVCCLQMTTPVDAAPLEFSRDIRPILSDKCFHCHGPDANRREAGLRFDTESGAKADLGGYFAIVPGDPVASEMIARVTSTDDDVRMPPPESGKSLSPAEITLLHSWVEQGAPWSQHWAYVAPRDQAPPSVADTRWPLHWIDEFVLAEIEARSLHPTVAADPTTLIRRLYFDVIGLPPTPEEVDRWLSDTSFKAYEAWVDQLLDSPHYGERMAMYWLDLVRYADTVGYHGDQDHNISPYRDYVIDAFNDNLPFDRFTREQLAGDLLPGSTIDQKIASGYNRLLQTSHEGGVQPKEYLAIYAADRVRNVSATWMGATLGCAQCHDHKYDPYTTRDFYAMAAFFADVDEADHFRVGTNALPTKRPPEIMVLTQRERRRKEALEHQLRDLRGQLEQVSSEQQESLRQQIKQCESQQRAISMNKRMTMITVALEQPRTTRVLPRGNWLDESGPVVEPAVPEFLGTFAQQESRADRLDLANWLTDPVAGRGGLTARVFVNRLWYLFFGTGLSRSLDDFGGQGEPPSHAALLDRLALEFIDSGWDVKHMVKLLLMTRTYRQASIADAEMMQADPENRWLTRQARYRLPAEIVRDNALAISGLLVDEIGGMSVKPYQPAGYYRHLNFPERVYHHDTDRQQWRRGVYVHWQRQFLHPTLRAFDAPSREECTAQRPRSNTPLAALALLNDPSFVEAARGFAQRIISQCHNDAPAARIEFAFRLALSRSPDDFETEQLFTLWERSQDYYQQHPDAASELLTVGLSPVLEGQSPVELASWTAVARALLNLHEVITRN